MSSIRVCATYKCEKTACYVKRLCLYQLQKPSSSAWISLKAPPWVLELHPSFSQWRFQLNQKSRRSQCEPRGANKKECQNARSLAWSHSLVNTAHGTHFLDSKIYNTLCQEMQLISICHQNPVLDSLLSQCWYCMNTAIGFWTATYLSTYYT